MIKLRLEHQQKWQVACFVYKILPFLKWVLPPPPHSFLFHTPLDGNAMHLLSGLVGRIYSNVCQFNYWIWHVYIISGSMGPTGWISIFVRSCIFPHDDRPVPTFQHHAWNSEFVCKRYIKMQHRRSELKDGRIYILIFFI